MKNKLLFTLLFSSSILFAQEKLSVEYRQTNEANPEKARAEEIEFQKKNSGSSVITSTTFTSYNILEFNNNLSFFSRKETINNDQNNAGGFNMSINVGGEFKGLLGDLINKNYKREVKLDQQNYVVNYPYKDYQWRITDIEDTILGYKVIKAVGVDNGKKVAAWFAPEIKVDAGPSQINGLPGLILKSVNELGNKLETTITNEAININMNPKKMAKIEPMKGKEISQEEFKKLQDESRKKMMATFSEQGVDKK